MGTPGRAESEAFAQRLRELRDGSGRSYGALARRMNVSASTLHRYCWGQTVPTQFGPVERLARLCGCEGDDLVALHRLWMTADAQRRMLQAGTAGTAGATDTSDLTDTSHLTEATDTPDTSDATAAPGGDLDVGRDPAPEPPVVPGGLPASPPAHPLRSRRTAYAAAALAAAVVVLALLMALGVRSPAADGQDTTPLAWSTNDQIWRNACDHAYLLDRDPAEVPPPPAAPDAEPWARSVGALHGGDTGVRITVQGRSDKPVVLQSLRVRVTGRRAPLKRNVYRMNHGCGGALTPRLFDVDLDTFRPLARSLAGSNAGEPIPAVSFPYKVSATDPEVLLVTGRTATCDCDWYLELEWSSGEHSGSIRIDDHGQPFRTSAIDDRSVYDYDTGSRRWTPAASARTRPGGA